MKYINRICYGFSLLLLCSALSVSSKEPNLNVAIIDPGLVLQNYPKAQESLKKLAASEQALNVKLDAKRKQIQEAKDQKKTETELQMLSEQIRLELEPEAKKLEEESNKVRTEINADVKKIVDEVSKDMKFDVVMVKSALFFGGTDITDKVISKLNGSKK